jgi:hypothetical protein
MFQLDPRQVRPLECRVHKQGPLHIGFAEIGPSEVCAGDLKPSQRGSVKIAPGAPILRSDLVNALGKG